MNMAYIDTMQNEYTVDLVILKDGRVLGIDSESVVLYDSMEHYESHEHNGAPYITLTKD